MNNYKTEQEQFWTGDFGDQYIDRNNDQDLLTSNITLFSKIIDRTYNVSSFFEVGANVGLNLDAINALRPQASLSGIEINQKAFEILNNKSYINGIHGSILDYKPDEQYDFVFTKTVLIHINPSELDSLYEKLYSLSSKYICVAEYFNPTPVTVVYRGEQDKLFKRDFAGDLLDKYSDLRLVDYGFTYSRDNNYKHDNVMWFLLEK